MKYQAILASYRITRNDDRDMQKEEIQRLDGKLFNLLGQFAADNDLGIVGGSALEHAE